MTKQKGRVYIFIKMVLLILESGSMINNMVLELKSGQMELNMKDIFMKG